MNRKIRNINLFSIIFLPVLLTLIYSPLLRSEYLVDCRGVGTKTFMGCTTDKSVWQYKMDSIM